MGDVKFTVESREMRGKGPARELRRRGLVPGVVYGGGREAVAIALDCTQFERMLAESDSGINTLIELEGNSPVAGRTVIAKELQREPVRGGVIHVDLYEVDLTEKIDGVKATIKFQMKKVMCLNVSVGNVGMDKEQITVNTQLACNFLASLLKKQWQNIGQIYIKSTMGPSQQIFF